MTTSAGIAADALTGARNASPRGNRLFVDRDSIRSDPTGSRRTFRHGGGVHQARFPSAEAPDAVGSGLSGGDGWPDDGHYVAFYRQHDPDDGHGDREAGKRAAAPTRSPTSGTVEVGAEASVGLYGIAVGSGDMGIAGSSLTIVDAGSVTGRSPGRRSPRAGRMGADTPMLGVDYATLSLDRAVVAAILPQARRLHGTLLPRTLSTLLGEAVLTLARGAATQPAETGFMIAALLAEAAEGAAPDSEGATGEALASRRFRTRLFIDAHIRRKDLDVNAVARGMGMSRSSLYRTFESVGGIEREIIRRRIGRLRSAVLHPGEARSIATLVSHLGFASAAHASRVFTAAYGIAPGRLRAGHRTPLGSPAPARAALDHGGVGRAGASGA